MKINIMKLARKVSEMFVLDTAGIRDRERSFKDLRNKIARDENVAKEREDGDV